MHKTEHRRLHLEFMESWIDVEKPERLVGGDRGRRPNRYCTVPHVMHQGLQVLSLN